jgi:hypothetical protein
LAISSPQTTQLRRLQELANNGPQVSQLRQLQTVAKEAAPSAAAGISTTKPQAAASQPNLTGLPDQLKGNLEALSGLSMNAVRVHYNSSKPAQLHALAYAQGTNIHLGPGQERHLPHEAWHVVQQAQGRVRPTLQMAAGVAVNDDAGLEREADVMGGRAAVMTSCFTMVDMAGSGGEPLATLGNAWLGSQADVTPMQSISAGDTVQRIVATAADTGLTNNMTDNFIKHHVLNDTHIIANLTSDKPPRLKSDNKDNKNYARDRDDGNIKHAYAQALYRFNNSKGAQTHILELPNNYPEYDVGRRMNVRKAPKVDNTYVEIVVSGGWHFEKMTKDDVAGAANPVLSLNAAKLDCEAVLKTTSSSTRKAKLGVHDKLINHYPAEHNPFLH